MIDSIITAINQSVALLLQYKPYLLYVSSFFLGGAGAWFISRTPLRLQLMDFPNERSSHIIPIPKGGGFGILMVVILTGLSLKLPTMFLFPVIIVALISFYGDFFQISVRLRLLVQFGMALVFVFPLLPGIANYYMSSRPVIFPVLVFLIPPFTIAYLAGSANFFNFMDGINGIAGICGAIAFGLLGAFGFIYSTNSSGQSLAIFSICIALACIGFLPFNMPKARVFLGDVGSILLGFVFAGMVVTYSGNYFDLLCLSSFLFPFYADEFTTMMIRLKDGQNLITPHRRHLYQILANEYGIAHWKVSVGYGFAQLLIGISIFKIRPKGTLLLLSFLTVYFIIFTVVTTLVRINVKQKAVQH
jgi:Fuc2NAc and GlcNAc transferase